MIGRDRIARVVCLGFALALTGCVMPDDVRQMQKELADVRGQLVHIQREQEESARRMQELQALAQVPSGDEDQLNREELADLNVRVQAIDRNLSVVGERVNDLSGRFERIADDIDRVEMAGGQPSIPPTLLDQAGFPPAGGPAVRPDPDELYKTAYADFSKGNYALAIAGFEEFFESFPTSAQADNALYWVGECSFSQGDFREAITHLDRMLELFPTSDKAAAANLKKGLAYLEQNLVGQSIVQLQLVSTQYPGTDEAKIAREKLQSLGAPI